MKTKRIFRAVSFLLLLCLLLPGPARGLRVEQTQDDPARATQLTAGLEENSAGREARDEIEKILEGTGESRRTQAVPQKVTEHGIDVLFHGSRGGTVRGFIPMRHTFEEGSFMRGEAKRLALKSRVRIGEPISVTALETRQWGSMSARQVIFRLDLPVTPQLFDEEEVFLMQIRYSNSSWIPSFLNYLQEHGTNPRQRLMRLPDLPVWPQLTLLQQRAVVGWLAQYIPRLQAQAHFDFFKRILSEAGRVTESHSDQAELAVTAVWGIRNVILYLSLGGKELEAIQQVWDQSADWDPAARNRAQGFLRAAASSLATPEAKQWLDTLPSTGPASAGLEEPVAGVAGIREFATISKFVHAYRAQLSAQELMGMVKTLHERAKDGLPMKVWFIPRGSKPAGSVAPRVNVHVLAGVSEMTDWETRIDLQLNQEGEDRLEQVFFAVNPPAAETDDNLPAIVIRQEGLTWPMDSHRRWPVIMLDDVNAIKALVPHWVYWLAMQENLRGRTIGPVIGVLPMKEGLAIFV